MSDFPPFPRLHPDIRILPFSSSAREKTYLLACPDGRCMEISGKLRELLRWVDGNHTCAEIASRLGSAWGVPVREEEARAWMDRHLLSRNLLLTPPVSSARPGNRRGKNPGLRGIPLFSARALEPFSEPLRLLFRPLLCIPLLWAASLCHLLLFIPWLSGTEPPPTATPDRVAAGILVLAVSVLFHELGHLSACRYFRCPHGEVRIGLYLIFPVLYANVSPAWRLSRKARLVVDLGGVYFQLLLTLPAYLLLRLTGDPLYLFLFLELDAMILFALNPFLRFDGYWVCSDLLGVANLRSRSLRLPRLLLQRITGRGDAGPRPFLALRGPETVGLALYTAGSCAFTLLIFVWLVRLLPERLATLPALLGELSARLAGKPLPPDSAGSPSVLFSLLVSLVLLFAAARMAWRTARGLLNNALRRHRTGGRRRALVGDGSLAYRIRKTGSTRRVRANAGQHMEGTRSCEPDQAGQADLG